MPKFVCCGTNFDGEQSYIEHRRLVHGEQGAVKRTCCGIRFFTDEGYAEHQSKVHGESRPENRLTQPETTPRVKTKPSGPAYIKAHYLKRCKVCRTPIRGLMSLPYRLRGIVPFSKNPQLCNR